MKCKYILSTLCMFGTLSLHAEEKGMGSILQQVGTQKKMVTKPECNKKNASKQSRFIFKDEYRSNGLGAKDKSAAETGKSKSYDYENKSRFKFKFNDGAGNNNFVAGQRSPDIGGPIGGGSMGGSSGGASVGGGSVGGGSMGGGQGGGRR